MALEPSAQPTIELSLNLQGVIDAAVNGGITKYQDAFFSTSFLLEYPEHAEEVSRLQHLMVKQVNILEEALKQHEKLISSEVRPLHDHLVQRWKVMKKSLSSFLHHQQQPVSVIRRSSKGCSRKGPLPPLPSSFSGVERGRLSSVSFNQSQLLESDDDEESFYSQPSMDRQVQLMTTLPSAVSPERCREIHKGPPLPPRQISTNLNMVSLESNSPPPIPPKSSNNSPYNSYHSPTVRKYEFIE